jgi:tetratricopeptide (TPR) repeat protein
VIAKDQGKVFFKTGVYVLLFGMMVAGCAVQERVPKREEQYREEPQNKLKEEKGKNNSHQDIPKGGVLPMAWAECIKLISDRKASKSDVVLFDDAEFRDAEYRASVISFHYAATKNENSKNDLKLIYKDFFDVCPKSSWLGYNHALALYQSGDKTEAINILKKSLENNGSHKPTQLLLKRIESPVEYVQLQAKVDAYANLHSDENDNYWLLTSTKRKQVRLEKYEEVLKSKWNRVLGNPQLNFVRGGYNPDNKRFSGVLLGTLAEHEFPVIVNDVSSSEAEQLVQQIDKMDLLVTLSVGDESKVNLKYGKTEYDVVLNEPELLKKLEELDGPIKVNRDIVTKKEKKKKKDVDVTKKLQNNPNRFALIIGNENYEEGITKAMFAINDADAIENLFVKFYGVDKKNILTLKDANIRKMENAVKEFEKIVSSRYDKNEYDGKQGKLDLLIFYSGHGYVGEQGPVLLPVDFGNTDESDVDKYSLSQKDLIEDIKDMIDAVSGIKPYRTVVILDACYNGKDSSGGDLSQNEGKGLPLNSGRKLDKNNLDLDVDKKNLDVDHDIILVSASKSDQIAWVDKKEKLGLFTKHWIKAVKGEANTGKDNKLTVKELDGYLEVNVNADAVYLTKKYQHPQIDILNKESMTKENIENIIVMEYK